LNILLLSTYDRAGGAEKVAFDLCRSYREYGHDARLYVRYKVTQERFVREVDAYAQTMPWAALCRRVETGVRSAPRFRGQYWVVNALRRLALPRRWRDQWNGNEDFNYPYSWRLADPDHGWRPDVIHAHNLHGDYFDLRALPHLAQHLPVVWTLHDTWALTGHCGHFIDCQRWTTGCGECPDLGRPPAIQRDATAANWQRKQEIYGRSRLAVCTPSRWLMSCVKQSMLRPAQTRVIPNGVDPDIYYPGDRFQDRAALGIPQGAAVIVFSASTGAGANPYKDFDTIRAAIRQLSEEHPSRPRLLICIGGEERHQDDASIRYTGYLSEPGDVARYYRCADLLLHSANAENFPLVVLEAMACGVAVVATGVGGIPEQIVNGQTGFVVPRGDSEAMAERVLHLMQHPDECQRMGEAAAIHARQSYGLKSQVETYLAWYTDLRAEYRGVGHAELGHRGLG
jgi:glycosyltransferase involved in cell wall biosynthesis